MDDDRAVFHAAHGNVADGSIAPIPMDISPAGLHAGRLALRKQSSLSGELIDVAPKYLLVPAELETIAEQQLSNIAAAKTEDANPFSPLSLVVDPRLTNPVRWYMVADPTRVDGLEFAYLEGESGPQIESRNGFEIDGVQIKVRLDFGSGWVDHRGWWVNG